MPPSLRERDLISASAPGAGAVKDAAQDLVARYGLRRWLARAAVDAGVHIEASAFVERSRTSRPDVVFAEALKSARLPQFPTLVEIEARVRSRLGHSQLRRDPVGVRPPVPQPKHLLQPAHPAQRESGSRRDLPTRQQVGGPPRDGMELAPHALGDLEAPRDLGLVFGAATGARPEVDIIDEREVHAAQSEPAPRCGQWPNESQQSPHEEGA